MSIAVLLALLGISVPADSQTGPDFVRGDVDGNGAYNLVDPILLLNYMTGTSLIDCLDAGDINDDGVINIVDPIYGLVSLFGGSAPPPPFPDCGPDPTLDTLDCVTFPPC